MENNLKQIFKDRGIKQVWLAEQAGVNRNTITSLISCHYLNQIRYIREELRSANASYMLISGCDRKNYDELKSELYPFTEEDLLRLPRYHCMNLIKNSSGYGKFITRLPRPIA